jgi:CBS domain-containing protein
MGMRLKHQAHQLIYDKQEPDNFINPETLTKIEKVTLTQIFKVIESFQVRIKLLFMRKLY